ncbi:nitroreductase [Sphingomonas deserti]|uniref:Nitroreductase n=2 Tax=Allosphingosinicella deserti TaxID=2116704 RepID=A0A2P7QLB8_9SPHN|nr:nitroreductase [Sphingomonas deserti]
MMIEREPTFPIDPLFLERWSPRAFDGAEIPHDALMAMFEAARWAPSAFNAQPWRFLYARRGDEHWPRFLDLLIPWNQAWAKGAAALVFMLSDTLTETEWGGTQISHSHSFDAGAAWACLALQAAKLGYQAHGMSGIELDRARADLDVPERFRIEAAAAIGRPGDPATLPESLRAREAPSNRRALEEIVFHGRFPG